jgi:hypothetical protein
MSGLLAVMPAAFQTLGSTAAAADVHDKVTAICGSGGSFDGHWSQSAPLHSELPWVAAVWVPAGATVSLSPHGFVTAGTWPYHWIKNITVDWAIQSADGATQLTSGTTGISGDASSAGPWPWAAGPTSWTNPASASGRVLRLTTHIDQQGTLADANEWTVDVAVTGGAGAAIPSCSSGEYALPNPASGACACSAGDPVNGVCQELCVSGVI